MSGVKGQHVRHENSERYLKEPSRDFMLEVIAKSGVSIRQFCFFFGIPEGTCEACIYNGSSHRPLPAKYWSIFYDPSPKPVPKEVKRKKIGQGHVTKERIKKDAAVSDLL